MLNLDLSGTKDDLYGVLRDVDDADLLRWLSDDKNMLKAELAVAERMARLGGKRKSYDTHAVELTIDETLDRLTDSLYYQDYKPSSSVAHIICRPVIREIFAARFLDRIVQHFVVDTINPWWDTRLYYGSSSCRIGKGTSYGVKLLDKHIRRASGNFAVPVYVIKLDISGYFMHIDREKLLTEVLKGLDQQFAGDYNRRYHIVKHAITEIIMDDPLDGVRIRGSYEDWRDLPVDKSLFWAAPGKGIVIGNVSSQVFSNIYLNQLDMFITKTLEYRFYGRYVDDFYFVVTADQLPQVERDIKAIDNFLHTLGLHLNKKKTRKIPSWQGVPFLGFVNYNGMIVPDKRIRSNYHAAVYDYIAGVGSVESVKSYIGMMKNYHSWKIIEEEFKHNRPLLNGLMGRVDY